MKDTQEFLAELFGRLGECRMSYAHRGMFSDRLNDHIMQFSEDNMEVVDEAKPTKRKVYFVMLESLQNITRHEEQTETGAMDAFFTLNRFPHGYMLATGNTVRDMDVPGLKAKLERVNSMSGEELADHCRKVLSAGHISAKGGAGLGLIEMSKRTGSKLVYNFKPLDSGDHYFFFQCNVKQKDTEEALPEMIRSTGLTEDIHRLTTERRLELFYFGNFVHENLKGLFRIMEGGSAEGRVLVSVMVELLQNICYHGVSIDGDGASKPGLFMVERHDGYTTLVTGNYVSNNLIPMLTTRVNQVNGLDTDGLEELFLMQVASEKTGHTPGAFLGFVDMRIKTGNLISYSTKLVSQQYSFLTVSIDINH
jgi:hypothetical protein